MLFIRLGKVRSWVGNGGGLRSCWGWGLASGPSKVKIKCHSSDRGRGEGRGRGDMKQSSIKKMSISYCSNISSIFNPIENAQKKYSKKSNKTDKN